MKLHEIKAGKQVAVKKIEATAPMKKKLMDMGLTQNTKVIVRKVAPLGDPIEITVRGYELTIRKADAAQIEVE